MASATADAAAPPEHHVDARHGVGRDVIVTFGGRLALTAAVLIGDVVLARGLGPEGKGAFTLVLALTSLGAAILGLGLDRSLAVFAARSVAVARRAFANSLFWALVVGGLGAIAILLLYGPAADGHDATGPLAAIMPPLTQSQLILVAISLPGELAYAIGLTGLLGRQRLLAYNTVRFVRRAVLTVLLISLVLIGRLDLNTVLLLNVATIGLTLVVIGFASWRAGMLDIRPSPQLMIEQLSFGARTVVGTIAERLHFRADAFMLTA
ncbi:MAG: oligosaccharide flippase family protein, partial [Candidatus Limnocylindrales bacterium]